MAIPPRKSNAVQPAVMESWEFEVGSEQDFRNEHRQWQRSHLPLVHDYSTGLYEPPVERSDREVARRRTRLQKVDPKLRAGFKGWGVGLLSATDYRLVVGRRTWLRDGVAVSTHTSEVHGVEAGAAYGRGTMPSYEIRLAGSTLLLAKPHPKRSLGMPDEPWTRPPAVEPDIQPTVGIAKPKRRRRPEVEELNAPTWSWLRTSVTAGDDRQTQRGTIKRNLNDARAFQKMAHATLLYPRRVDALDDVIARLVELYLEELASMLGKPDPRMLRLRPRRGPKRRGLYAPVRMGGADPADERELVRRLVAWERFEQINPQQMIALRASLQREAERDRAIIWQILKSNQWVSPDGF